MCPRLTLPPYIPSVSCSTPDIFSTTIAQMNRPKKAYGPKAEYPLWLLACLRAGQRAQKLLLMR